MIRATARNRIWARAFGRADAACRVRPARTSTRRVITHHDKPGGWNLCGYHNPEFDALASQAALTTQPQLRRQLILKMQEIIMRDTPFLPLYNPLLVEAARVDRFQGWVSMVGGIGNLWSLCELRPVQDRRPAAREIRP